jgi:two-component system response regulator AtoC
MRDKILLIDDELNLRKILHEMLERAGYEVFDFDGFAKAKPVLNTEDFALVLTDLQMPEFTGMDVLEYCQLYSPDLPVVLITAFGTVERAVSALKAGAFDFVLKPFEQDELFRTLEKAIQSRKRRRREPTLEALSAVGVGPVAYPLFGDQPSTKELRAKSERAALSLSPVLMYGEVGTGKRAVAFEIHRNSAHARGPFIQINCDAIPPVFQTTEIFGVEKGATPMSFFSKPGSLELAQGGTLFLEEIGTLSIEAQNALFTALEQEYFSRVGGLKKFPNDFRIIATSSYDLSDSVKKGTFHVELFHKLSVETLVLLPLKDRTEDIVSHLVPYFLERACQKLAKPVPILPKRILDWYQTQSWSGNLAELEKKVLQMVHLSTGDEIKLPE